MSCSSHLQALSAIKQSIQNRCFCTRYLDQVVAKLPFDANFWLIAKVAHRGLKFPKPNDCAVVSTSAPPSNTKSPMCF